jgi:hypothetical protein
MKVKRKKLVTMRQRLTLKKRRVFGRRRGTPASRVLKLTQDAARARWLSRTLLEPRPVKLRKVSFVRHTPEALDGFGT